MLTLEMLFDRSTASYDELSDEAKARADKDPDAAGNDVTEDMVCWTTKGDFIPYDLEEDIRGYGMIPFLRGYGYEDEVHDLVVRYLYGKVKKA